MHEGLLEKMTDMRLLGMKRALTESLQAGAPTHTADELPHYLL